MIDSNHNGDGNGNGHHGNGNSGGGGGSRSGSIKPMQHITTNAILFDLLPTITITKASATITQRKRRSGMNIGYTINRLNEMEQEVYRIAITVQQKISDQAIGDARPSAFYKLAQLFHYYNIYFILKEGYLQHRQCYVNTYLEKWHQAWLTSATVGGKSLVHHNDHHLLNKDFDQVNLCNFMYP